MEQTIGITIAVLLLPYILFVWVYGFILLFRLIKKERHRDKNLIVQYERLSQEDRMELDRKIITQRHDVETPRPSTPARVARAGGGWVQSPSPRVERPTTVSPDFPEGPLPAGRWETPEDQPKTPGNLPPTP